MGTTSRVILCLAAAGCCALGLSLGGGTGGAATRPPVRPPTGPSVRPPAGPRVGPNVPPLGDAALRPEVRDLRVLVVGDSWGGTLGNGMEKLANAAPDRHIVVVKAARGGCGIMQPAKVVISNQLVAKPECNDWPEFWRGLVARVRPDAVLLETGIYDAHTRQQLPGQDGPTSISDPVFRTRFGAQVDRAVRVLGSGGARVFLTTVTDLAKPYWNEVNGRWSNLMNAALRAAAARDPGVRLLDLHGQLCTGDRDCPRVISGIDVYDETGHPTPAARDRLAAWLLNAIHADLHAHAS
ncbi:DUF459 domain-containing protein [Actinoallomurus rhizosphaericola]|uniref:DUF459 domain-containing protein n=1 Tax=Actinoallomurus rhizosphaericola TaxID=2952536 RepID=UPI0020930037|nr:SGNH hydrolase domain-containing protein [Actinoallomurus rhizosphaericola]MCO5994815.1 GDSL-type esterase/lipase family protein [Actinoallomurus rhizosphaericola]